MITCGLEQLNKANEDTLRLWLAQGQAETLVRVVKAQVQRYECEALKDALTAGEGNIKIDSANANLQRARKYANFLEVLKELVEQKDRYQIAKLS
jgi:hypothetical protein